MLATDFRSLTTLECLGVPFGHSLIPYSTRLNFFSDSVTEIAGVGLDAGGGSTGAVSPFSAPE